MTVTLSNLGFSEPNGLCYSGLGLQIYSNLKISVSHFISSDFRVSPQSEADSAKVMDYQFELSFIPISILIYHSKTLSAISVGPAGGLVELASGVQNILQHLESWSLILPSFQVV